MHIPRRRPCAAAVLALMGLAFASSSTHAQSSSLSAVALPTNFQAVQVGQWYVHSQTTSASAASNTAYDSTALSTLPGAPGSDVTTVAPGLLTPSAAIHETGGSATSQVQSDFSGVATQVVNGQDATLVGPSLALSFSATLYAYYSSAPGPVTFTATLDGRLNSALAGDSFGMVFLANGLAPSTRGLEAVADSVGIDLDLEELDLVRNIRDAAPTIDVRTSDVTLRKDSGLPGGVNVFDSSFSLVSQGQYVDCGGLTSLPICGTYQHLFAMGMLVAATNNASAQYGLSVSSVQTPLAAVPEPGTVALTLSGLAGLAVWRRRTAQAAGKA